MVGGMQRFSDGVLYFAAIRADPNLCGEKSSLYVPKSKHILF